MKRQKKGRSNKPSAPRAVSLPRADNGGKPKDAGGVDGFPLARRRSDWLFGLLLLAVTLIAYQPLWHAGFIWDDDEHITRPELRSLHGIVRIWTQLGATQQYYPVVHTVFWVEHRLWGDAPLGYHLVNILLHVFSALLLAKILRQLQIPGAWLAAAIFALHPVQAESVAWISELKNTLSGVFYFSAALAYLDFDRSRSVRSHGFALALFALGLLSKTVIATLPVGLLVIFWWQRGKLSWRRDVAPLIPFFVAGIGTGLLTAWVERKFIGAEGAEFDFSIVERCLIAGRAISFYLGNLVWPMNLVFMNPRWNVSQAAWWQYFFPAAALLLLGTLMWLRRQSRGPLVALLFFVVTLFPALGFFNVYPFRYSFVADHFQYLACIGPISLAAAGIELGMARIARRQPFLLPALTAALLSICGALTWHQCGMYADAETLWRATLARNPRCWMAHNNLGALHVQRGELDQAIAEFRKSLEIEPANSEALLDLGMALAIKGEVAEAVAQFRRAVELKPDYAEAHYNLGAAMTVMGQTAQAAAEYQKALEFKPHYPEARHGLGLTFARNGQTDEAISQYRLALALNPDYAEDLNDLGSALFQRGEREDAIAQFRQAVELKPEFAEAHYNLGVALTTMGQSGQAAAEYAKALEIKPDYPEARYNLGLCFARSGRLEEAIAQFQQALQIKPDYVEVLDDLGLAYVQKGELDKGIEQLRRAVDLKPGYAAAHNNLGIALVQKGAVAEGVAQFRQAVEIKPDYAEAHYDLGVGLAAMGQTEAAAAQYRKALELKPDYPEARRRLGPAD
jgi:Flp pilus assembly protein TadD